MLLENKNFKVLKHHTDAETSGVTSDKIALKEIKDVALVVLVDGVADEDVTFSVVQYKGATTKRVALKKPVLAKFGTAKVFTQAELVEGEDTDALKYTIPVGAVNGMFVIDVDAIDLDSNDTFNELAVAVDAVAKNITVLAVYEATHKPAYKQEI